MAPPPLKISAEDHMFVMKIDTQVAHDAIYWAVYINFNKLLYFILYELIMLIYA